MNDDNSPVKIGLIGLGLLGEALAQRFLGAGFEVRGHDIDPARRKALESTDVSIGGSAGDVATSCKLIVLCLPNSKIVEAVITEIEDQLQPQTTIVDVTTGHPDDMIAIGDRLAAKGINYLDATVAGSSAQAREGQVIVMIGGEEKHATHCRGLFESFARRIFHVGPRGSGARMKLVVNLVLGLNRAVLAEGLAYAEHCGLDGEAALEVLGDSMAYSRIMDTKGEKMLKSEYSPQARLSQHLKDVRLILDTGSSTGAKLPLSTLHGELLEQVESRGHGGEDNSAIMRYFRE